MSRATHMVTAFNAGEWRGSLDGRIDHERYHVACRRMRNFIPLVEGAAEFRPGTRYVYSALSPSFPSTLIPFKFNTSQAYILEFGENAMRVFMDHGIVESSPGVPFQIGTPYTAEQAKRIQFVQSADVMWLCHPDVPVHTLSRTGHASWTLATYAPKWEPFRAENLTETTTMYASAATGAITLTANVATFSASDVGRIVRLREVIESKNTKWSNAVDLISADTGSAEVDGVSTCYWEGNVYRLAVSTGAKTGNRPPIHLSGTETDGRWTWTFLHSGAGYAQITGYTSPTVVSATVIKVLPDSVVGAPNATFRWSFGAWDSISGYPRCAAFFEDRLWFMGTNADPDRMVATRPGGAYDDFREDQTAEGALAFRLNSAEPNVIESVVPTRVLNILTSGGVFPAAGIDTTEAVSIENLLKADRQVNYGARSGVQAIAVDSVVVFLQRSGRQIRELLFNSDESAFQAHDIVRQAAHLSAPGIKRIAYQQEPTRTLWCPLEDGGLLCATYDRPQESLGWYMVELGGTSPYVDSVAVIPHPDEDQDEVWVSVARSFGGGSQRTIEYFERIRSETTALEDCFYLDCGASYNGAPATVIGNLLHLEGQTVRIFADGARVADQTVSGGTVTLADPASVVHVGLGYNGLLIPMRIEAGGDDGTSQGKTKRIHRIVIRLWRSAEGTKFGTLQDVDEVLLRDSFDVMDSAPDLVDEDTIALPWPGEYEQGGYVVIRHEAPTPCAVVGLMSQLISGER